MNPDVIIIGAGVIGTACAYFLSRRGMKVLILERRHLCAGASGASAALIMDGVAGMIHEPVERLKHESHQLLLEIEPDFKQSIERIHGGSMLVADNEGAAGELKRAYSDPGSGFRFLDGAEARDMEPMLGPQVAAAVFNPVNYHVNPFRLCKAYLDAALHRGARVEYGVEVYGIDQDNGRPGDVATDRGEFRADWVVVAAGAHTPDILSGIGCKLPIQPARGQVIITEACPRMTDRILFFPDHLYIKQTAAGNFYIGSHTEYVGFVDRITLDKITTYIRILGEQVPLLSKMRAVRFFSGFRPLSRDELPIIGSVPGCPQLIVASGHGRSGMMLSAGTGKTVSELIADGRAALPMDAFSVDRFCT
jgi:glycine/D-amino acid oxidase-like deaminating enzyme